MKTLPTYIALIGIAAFAGNGCSDGTTSTPDPSDPISDPLPDPIDVPETEGCENLNHRYCSLPFPSDRWLAADSDSATGYRLRYDARAIPQNKAGTPFNVTPFDRLDGASPSGQLMTLFDEPADLTGQAFHDSIEKSLDESALIALIDLETGERVAHWVENDARAEAADETLFFIHPAARLLPNRSYGVAIGALNGASGAPLEPSPAFAALRDDVPTTSTAIEARRAGFETLFEQLETAGIERSSLLEAWRFHTGSDENIRQTMLAMRADALTRLGDDGIGCTITEVDEDFRGVGARRLQGTFTVPWYHTADLAPSEIVRDDNDAPTFQRNHEVAFTAVVPQSLLTSDVPGPLMTWGHGLFGEAKSNVSDLTGLADVNQTVVVGTDWHGMSSKDLIFLASALSDTSKFYMVGENLQQGMISQIALTRTMLGACKDEAGFQSNAGKTTIDPAQRYYIGGSQGSILGGTLLTLSPDHDRGALIVGGAGFSFMIERSIHFNKFEAMLTPSYESRLATGVLMVLSQHVWDNGETGAWLGAAKDGLPGIGPKEFLYLVAKNDAQVSNLSSDIAMRSMGVPVLEDSVTKPWGIPVVSTPHMGSAYVTMDVGDRDVPEGNLSPDVDDGGHGNVGLTPEAQEMVMHFLNTGEVISTCDGECDLTE